MDLLNVEMRNADHDIATNQETYAHLCHKYSELVHKDTTYPEYDPTYTSGSGNDEEVAGG
jgi:hypothetical protein